MTASPMLTMPTPRPGSRDDDLDGCDDGLDRPMGNDGIDTDSDGIATAVIIASALKPRSFQHGPSMVGMFVMT